MDTDTTGADALEEAAAFIRRFCVLPTDATVHTMAVWAAHTHVFKAFQNTPRLAFLSEQPASGKTRAMHLTGVLSCQSKPMTSYSAAVLRRQAAKARTLLLDETDTIFRTTGSAPEMQAVLNDGFGAGGTADHVQGSQLVETSVFCPVAMAGLRELPPATASRTIIVRMQKRRGEQPIEAWQTRMHEPLGHAIGEALGSWAQANAMQMAEAWPDLPDGVEDRAADVWTPLLAVAGVAGGPWPERIAAACDEFVNGVAAEPTIPPLARLLIDIRTVWSGDRLRSSDLCGRLMSLQGAPYGTLWPLEAAPRELAAMLRGAGIAPVKMRIDGGEPVQGYHRREFERVWNTDVPAEQAA